MDEVRDPRPGLDDLRGTEAFAGWQGQRYGSGRDDAGFRGPGRVGGRGGRGGEPLEQRLERWVSRGRDLVDGVSGARPGTRAAGSAAEGRGSAASRGAGAGFQPGRLGRWVEERLDWLLDDDGEDSWREPWQQSSGPPPPPETASPAPPPARRVSPEPRVSPERSAGGRRGLEAISRRPAATGADPRRREASGSSPQASPAAGRPLNGPPPRGQPRNAPPPGDPPPLAGAAGPAGEASAAPRPMAADDWPDEASFSLNRWQRPQPQRPADPLQPGGPSPLPPPASGGPPASGPRRPLPRSSRRR